MANTYTLIESQVLGSSAASVTFSAIPATYTDLKIVASSRNDSTFGTSYVRFNGTTTGYTYTRLFVNLTAAYSDGGAAPFFEEDAAFTANTFGNGEIYIPNYASANYKSFSVDSVTENNATANYLAMVACLWSNTAAITSVNIQPVSGSFATLSSFNLYGISNTI